MTEYTLKMRDRGELTIPKKLREKYNLDQRTEVKLIPKTEGIMIRPRIKDPVQNLRGLAKDIWPKDLSSVEIIRHLRLRVDFEAREKLQ